MAAHSRDESTYAVVLTESVDKGVPDAKKHFRVVESAKPQEIEFHGEQGDDAWLMVEVLALSADVFQRGTIKPQGGQKPGEPLQGFVAGRILSVGPAFQKTLMPSEWSEGDLFAAALPFRTVQLVKGKEFISKTFRKITSQLGGDVQKIGLGLNVLGMPGATAYAAMDVLKPEKGQVAWVSDAGGAVGGLTVQLLKNVYQCTVIASCGGEEKTRRLKDELAPDHVIDYTASGDSDDWDKERDFLVGKLKEMAPDGIDMYIDFVGSAHFEAAFACLKPKGRIALAGSMSHINEVPDDMRLESINAARMIYQQQRIEGFLSFDWLDGNRGNFMKDMEKYFKDGLITHRETVYRGIDKWPEAFASIFSKKSQHVGKVIVYT